MAALITLIVLQAELLSLTPSFSETVKITKGIRRMVMPKLEIIAVEERRHALSIFAPMVIQQSIAIT